MHSRRTALQPNRRIHRNNSRRNCLTRVRRTPFPKLFQIVSLVSCAPQYSVTASLVPVSSLSRHLVLAGVFFPVFLYRLSLVSCGLVSLLGHQITWGLILIGQGCLVWPPSFARASLSPFPRLPLCPFIHLKWVVAERVV